MDGMLYSDGNYEKIQGKTRYLPLEIELYPNLTVQECLEYMGDLAGVSKKVCKRKPCICHVKVHDGYTVFDLYASVRIRLLTYGRLPESTSS